MPARSPDLSAEIQTADHYHYISSAVRCHRFQTADDRCTVLPQLRPSVTSRWPRGRHTSIVPGMSVGSRPRRAGRVELRPVKRRYSAANKTHRSRELAAAGRGPSAAAPRSAGLPGAAAGGGGDGGVRTLPSATRRVSESAVDSLTSRRRLTVGPRAPEAASPERKTHHRANRHGGNCIGSNFETAVSSD